MTLQRENILAAITAALASTSGVSGRVWRSRAEALIRDEAPAIVIEPITDDPASPAVSGCKIDWTLRVAVAVYARGDIPDQLAAPILADVHNRLMADRTLSGWAIDVYPGSTDYQIDKADLTCCWAVTTWIIRHRTLVTSIQSPA